MTSLPCPFWSLAASMRQQQQGHSLSLSAICMACSTTASGWLCYAQAHLSLALNIFSFLKVASSFGFALNISGCNPSVMGYVSWICVQWLHICQLMRKIWKRGASDQATGVFITIHQAVFSWWKSLSLAIVAHFVVIWQLMSNHKLISIIRFIS